MTTKYINGSGLSKLLQLISNSVGQALSSISNKLSYNDKVHANLINVTYDELCDIRNSYTLIPGQYYRIMDYVTTTSQENTMSNGQNYQIIVLAISNQKLSEEAMTRDGCKVWYCLDNDTSRFAWAGATKRILEVECVFTAETESGALNTIIGDFRRDESLIIEESDITYYGYTSTGAILGSSTPLFNTDTVLWYTEEFPEIGDRVNHTFYQILDGEMMPINMLSEFSESQEPIGKGVIYRMIDENGNDCPYDFKSIMFKNPNDETDDKYYYTFYYEDSNEVYDATTSGITKDRCYNNVIKYYKEGSMMYIPNNIFNITHYISTHRCCNNTFGFNCYNNTFESNCYNNTFGDDCYNNILGDNCYNNTFDSSCYNNTFGARCYNNTFDFSCYNNTFGSFYNNNTFGFRCHDNSFGSDCYKNTFSSNCYSNTFGSSCYNNTFGDDCYDNSFIYVNVSDSSQTEILNGIVNCDFSNEYQYNKLKHLRTANTDTNCYLINVHFCKGLKGYAASSNIIYNNITIEGALHQNTETKVAINSKGELKIYCEADLVV